MRHSKIIMLSALVMTSLMTVSHTASAATTSHEIQSFFDDSTEYKIGDAVPGMYRTKPYEIIDWQQRHLPAPDAGTHWTYIGGNYALITNSDGTITKAESGDIFFQ